MKIGILTFHRAHNYGAVLQCYALQEILKGMHISSCVLGDPDSRIPPEIDLGLRADLFDLDNQGATELNHFLDYFEIDIDFEEGFISFFMKKEYTKK